MKDMGKKRLKNTFFSIILLFGISCTSEVIPEPEQCDGLLSAEANAITSTSCGQPDGSVTIEVSNGTPPYTITIDNFSHTNGNFDELPAGNYTAEVEDAGGCFAQVTFQILNDDGINITVDTEGTTCGRSTGRIVVNASGGVPPYTYSIDNDNFQDDAEFSGLSAGDYTLVARDNNDCEVTEEIIILTDVVFAEVKSIMTSECATSGCHDGSRRPNLLDDNVIQSNATEVLRRMESTSRPMPPSGKLPDDQIEKIACWVSDGAPIN